MGRGDDGGVAGPSGAGATSSRGAGGSVGAPPRLSSFLRAFGTSRAPTPADVDAAYVARRRVLDARRDAPSGDARGGGGGGGGARAGGAPRGGDPRGGATARVAALVWRGARAATPPPTRVRDALETFLSSVVAVAGGDTLLPDELRDAALVAFEAAAPFAADAIEAARKAEAEAAYAAEPDLVRRPADADARKLAKSQRAALAEALGPLANEHFPAFSAAVEALVRVRYEDAPPGVESSVEREREGGAGPTPREEKDDAVLKEFGADLAFVPPTRGADRARRAAPSDVGEKEKEKEKEDSAAAGGGSSFASAMRRGFRAAEDTARRKDSVVNNAASAESFADSSVPAAEARASDQLGWLRDRCAALAEAEAERGDAATTWEDRAFGIARIALGRRSDDEIGAELFDLLGETAMEVIAGVVERRSALADALRRRIGALRETMGETMADLDDPDGGMPRRKVGGGSGAPGATVTISSVSDKKLEKLRKKEERKVGRALARGEGEPLLEWLARSGVGFAALCEGDWEAPAPQPLAEEDVFDALRGLGAGGFGGKKALPAGTKRIAHERYEEITVPAATKRAMDPNAERLVPIDELHEWARPAFAGMESLNRIQSLIYPAAYLSNENLLVCAPTGAGKTNIAMMTVLREIGNRLVDEDTGEMIRAGNGSNPFADFKIVYVAPMKALAAEVTAAFGRRLAPLGVSVRELTGDTQLSKRELEETCMIVTTPEKWDVITRKSGEASTASALRLLIVDEVHLLNDERGPVIETLIARTHRQVETTQARVRIVGLSATLPNPADAARFLGVGDQGLFVFDQSFRPIPLTQIFVGVTEQNAMKRAQVMAEVAYRKCVGALRQGKQAMVFVHSRKDTVKTARQLAELAANDTAGGSDAADLIAPSDASNNPRVKEFQALVNKSRNPELKELFAKGLGCHNAGMLRSDRSLVERAFAAGVVKILVCTATLAWGVNLPAHLVVIKGTTLYDPQKGGFRDLGVLDVQQIFGRAGRPGFDTSGVGVIVTEHKKLPHYLALLTHQTPIESQFVACLADNLNAEIVLGTVTSVKEGAAWLGYTYLHTRVEKNPLAYGLTWDDVRLDPGLVMHRRKLVVDAARRLDRARMIRFDEKSGQLYQTEAGRIASHFYIKMASMVTFEEHLKRHMTMPDVFHMIAHASEFENVAPREDEMVELERLRGDRRNACPIEISKATMADKAGKVNLLLQVYVSRKRLDAFSLVADSSYVSQNASRICRALFELTLRRGWPSLAETMLTLSKAVDARVWPHQHALRQFEHELTAETIHKLEDKRATVERLWDMSVPEVASMLRANAEIARRVLRCVEALPHLDLDATVQPITRSVLRVQVTLTPNFRWIDQHHGGAQRWLVWVEDPVNEHVYHSETFALSKKQHREEGAQRLAFTIPIFEPLPPQYFLRATSEHWLGCESFHELNFAGLILPSKAPAHTDLLDLHPLPRSALRDPKFEALYERKFTHFNAIQTQAFHTLFHKNANVLLGAPTGSGKTVSAELAMMKVFRDTPDRKVLYIAPLKALVRERVDDWRKNLCPALGKTLAELTGDHTPDVRALLCADIIVATPEKWDGISRNWRGRAYVQQVALMIIDEIHLLGSDRGAILEVIVSRMRYVASRVEKPIRVVGLSTALANAQDLADWLGIDAVEGEDGVSLAGTVDSGLFNFRPSVRPVPLECHIQGFPGKFYCPRMQTMNKPTYAAIQTHSPNKPALVFVSSRRQTRLTANDLIAYAVADEKPDAFARFASEEAKAAVLARVRDPALKHCLGFGVGLHHAGLGSEDRQLVETLFARCEIQVLVSTSTLAWGVNLPAHLVVIKGTEFYDGKARRYVDFPITDALQMMGRAGRPQFDTSGVCVIMCHEPKKAFYKKFLYEPFPVESSLVDQLPDHFNAEVVAGTIASKQDAVDYLTWTYFFRRLVKNPSYYDLESVDHDAINAYLSKIVESAFQKLRDARCVEIDDETDAVAPLFLGHVASHYYLKHETVACFARTLKPAASHRDVLDAVCAAAEYDEVPVRHNEDAQNAELMRAVRRAGGWGLDERLADDPHAKTNLLFQAHFLRLDLPGSDYVLDAKGAIDQSARITQAVVDVCAEAGWLGAALTAMNVQQMIMQGRMITHRSATSCPGIDETVAEALEAKAGMRSLAQLAHTAQSDRARAVAALRAAGVAPEKRAEDVAKIAARFPVVHAEASRSIRPPSDGGRAFRAEVAVKLRRRRKKQNGSGGGGGGKGGKGGGAEGDDTNTKGRGANTASAPRALCPMFPKLKEEGWWLVVGDRTTRELHALRRVSFGDATETKLEFETDDPGAEWVLYVVSDCYLGLDQEVEVKKDKTGVRGVGGRDPKTDAKTLPEAKTSKAEDVADPDSAELAASSSFGAAKNVVSAATEAPAAAEAVASPSATDDTAGFWLDQASLDAEAEARWPDDADPFFWEGERDALENDDERRRSL